MAILETKSLTKSFGALTAVNGVSLAIEAGSLHSIIGPERRGQDHAIQPAHRHIPTDIGTDPLRRQKDITGTPASRVAHLGLARSYQRTTVFPAFSVFDNVWVAAFATGQVLEGFAAKKTNGYAEVAERARQALHDVGLARNQPSSRARSRTASSASSSWPSRSPRRRACCCWTSRPPASRPRRRAAWWRWCAR